MKTKQERGLFHRLTALALSVLMVLTMLPTAAIAAEAPPTSGQCGDNLTWKYNTSTQKLTISGTGDMWDYNDERYDEPDLPVTPWLSHKETLTAITIQEGVTSIGQHAFDGCTSLKSVTIPNSVTTIGNSAFFNCTSLKTITIPDSVEVIHWGAFARSGLESVHLGKGLQSFNEKIMPSLGVFSGCVSLKKVYVDSLVHWMSLKLGTVADNPLCYGGALYCGGKLVEHLVIPESISFVHEAAFYGCASLKSVTCHPHVDSISRYAFANCVNLEKISLSDEITYIGKGAFCDTKWYNAQSDGPLYLHTYLLGYKNQQPSGHLKIKPGTTVIAAEALRDCSALTGVTIPESMVYIHERAFGSCVNLTSVSIPDNVWTVGSHAFYHCTSLQDIHLGSNVHFVESSTFADTAWYNAQSDGLLYLDGFLLDYKGRKPAGHLQVAPGTRAIAGYAFLGCSDLTSVSIPDNVWTLGDCAFYYCTSLQDIHLGSDVHFVESSTFANTAWYEAQNDGLLYLGDCLLGYKGAAPTGELAPKSGTRVIAGNAFDGCDGLSSITFPETLEKLNSRAFSQCTGLKKIRFTGNAPDCGSGAFGGVTATAYYPANDPTWTQEIRDDYPSSLTWVPYGDAPQTLPAPKLTITHISSTGKPYLKWTSVDGADKYDIYSSTSKTGTYTRLSAPTGTTLRHNSAQAGTTYYYKIRALSADGRQSDWSPIYLCTCDLARPDVTVSARSDGKPVLTWKAVPGAVKYEIWRSVNGGDYARLTATTGTKLTNTSVEGGKTYSYKVRAIASRSAANSAYSLPDEITVKSTVPQLTVVNSASTGKPYLKWTAVDGAVKYEVYRATSKSGPFTYLASTRTTHLLNSKTTAGRTYYYKVRAVEADGSKSAFSSVRLRTCDLARPDVKLITRSGHPYLYWKHIPGAVKYEVYCSMDGGSFTRLASPTGSRLTHSSAKKGHTYTYKVRAIASKSSANSAYSSYDTIKVK